MQLLVIHGPNLNMLGKRNPIHYGFLTLEGLYDHLIQMFPDVVFTFYQSNFEGEILEVLHHAYGEDYDAILINPGPLTHTSIALRDALEILSIPKVEVHFSDIGAREPFRKTDVIKDVCEARFMGKLQESYTEAVTYLLNRYHK